jgi:hypothetical protein
MTEANALHSLYGGATALAGNVGGQDRDQEAWTPDDILAIAGAALGRIELDPCGASAWELAEVVKAGKVKRKAVSGGWFADVTLSHAEPQVSPHGGLVLRGDGLTTSWQGRRTFVNSPYDPLEPWLRKCASEAAQGTPIVSLGPVRPHRRWWLPLVRTGQIVFLNYDVRFKGWTQAVPFPLCLVAWNCTIPVTQKETGRWPSC